MVPLLNPAHQHRDIDMSSMKIEIDSIFFITFCLKRLQIIHGMACLILSPCLGTCPFHAISHVKGHWIFSFGHWKVMENSWNNYYISIQWIHPVSHNHIHRKVRDAIHHAHFSCQHVLRDYNVVRQQATFLLGVKNLLNLAGGFV